jgi:hypothetical protein
MGMTKEQLIEDLKVMIAADTKHLEKALERGDTTHAHGFVDAIIGNRRQLEDISPEYRAEKFKRHGI